MKCVNSNDNTFNITIETNLEEYEDSFAVKSMKREELLFLTSKMSSLAVLDTRFFAVAIENAKTGSPGIIALYDMLRSTTNPTQLISATEYNMDPEKVVVKDLLFASGDGENDNRGYLFASDLNFGLYCFSLEQIVGDNDDVGLIDNYKLIYRYSVPLSGKVSTINWDRTHRMIVVATLIPVKIFVFQLKYGGSLLDIGAFRAESEQLYVFGG